MMMSVLANAIEPVGDCQARPRGYVFVGTLIV